MSRSFIIQLGIFGLILLISYFVFLYLNRDSENISFKSYTVKENEQIRNISEPQENDIGTNKILDLSYKSRDEKGNVYEINSISGSISDDDENVLILENVSAEILIFNYGTFYIKSDKAKYNKLNLNTHFFNNVNLNYLNHIIKSEDLFLKYMDKEINILNNVIYNNEENLLEADKIDLDLASKKSKIYMNSKNEKVKAVIKN
tara:strand:+ start:461 stop:1069 length:609 start_codon:yes stop_codon:yes gene_type:complete